MGIQSSNDVINNDFGLLTEQIQKAISSYISKCKEKNILIYGAFNNKHICNHFFIADDKIISFIEHSAVTINTINLQEIDNDFLLKILNQKNTIASFDDAMDFIQSKLKYIPNGGQNLDSIRSTFEAFFIANDINKNTTNPNNNHNRKRLKF